MVMPLASDSQSRVFATVPISRINSWVDTCRENKQLVAHPIHYHVLSTCNLRNIMNLPYHIHTYLSGYPLQHLTIGSILVWSWGKTDSFFQLKHVTHPVLYMIPTHDVCSNGSYFTRSTLPLQLLQGLNTFIQVNIMGARHDIYIQTHILFTGSLLVLPFDPQAGQLALDFHIGNTMSYGGQAQSPTLIRGTWSYNSRSIVL